MSRVQKKIWINLFPEYSTHKKLHKKLKEERVRTGYAMGVVIRDILIEKFNIK